MEYPYEAEIAASNPFTTLKEIPSADEDGGVFYPIISKIWNLWMTLVLNIFFQSEVSDLSKNPIEFLGSRLKRGT